MRRPRIGFLLPHYGSHSRSYMPSVVRALADAGAEVDVIHPLERAVDLLQVGARQDRYVLGQRSSLSFTWPAGLRSQGAVMLNPYPLTGARRARATRPPVFHP